MSTITRENVGTSSRRLVPDGLASDCALDAADVRAIVRTILLNTRSKLVPGSALP